MEKPASVHTLAEAILRELSSFPSATEIVLGGYFALQHYADYRSTNDVAAWWRTRATPDAEAAIRAAVQSVAARENVAVRERLFGETLSLEQIRDGRKMFSFQIAVRTVELEPPLVSAWPPILIETLIDNVGSKMNALVDRGSPRDFVDIEAVVARALVSKSACWEAWSRKNPGAPVQDARQKVRMHLSALEQRRPLESIEELSARDKAHRTREWFKAEFLQP